MALRLGAVKRQLDALPDIPSRTLVRALDDQGVTYKVHLVEFEEGEPEADPPIPSIVYIKIEED